MIDEQNKTWSDRRHLMWWPITFTKYRVENQRLYTETGLLSTREEECLLYRIMDVSYERSFGNRVFGTGTIRLTTKDASTPVIELKNIADSRRIKDLLSQCGLRRSASPNGWWDVTCTAQAATWMMICRTEICKTNAATAE